MRLADSPEDVEAAQRLRFEVFNVEMGEGLEGSFRTGLDRDRFDAVCDHLLVHHLPTGALAGTYRVQTGLMALAGHGYYSEQEFDFGPFEDLRPEMIEVGRACVARRHRHLSALGMLWRGIAQYARSQRARYLVGCSSLPTTDTDAAWAAYHRLARTHLAPDGRITRPRPGYACPSPRGEPVSAEVPKLLQAYLGLGARICGAPALDAQFKTVDFLTLLDLEELPPAARERFLQ